jgi:glycosyltransferase involved in cell wall biosynthesis
MKLLVFAHVPPHDGQGHAVRLMLNSFGGDQRKRRAKAAAEPPNDFGIECYHVNARLSPKAEDVDRFRGVKPVRLLLHCLEAIWCRFRYGATNFYYLPASGKRFALYCDWLVMLVCRPFFEKTILHWHAAGLAQWLETAVSIHTRSLTYRFMKNADLSIVLSDFNRRDAEKLTARRIAVVGAGMPDPCPQFEGEILPRRRARVALFKKVLSGDSPPANGDDTAVKVLYLAPCTRGKGVFDTVEGVALANEKLAAEKSPLRFRLTLIGEFTSSAEENELRELCRQRGLQQTIECLGLVSAGRRKQALGDADLFCFPTYHRAENQPASLIEATAFGLPVVTTRWRSIPEILPKNYPGLVDPKSPAQVADALLALMTRESGENLRENFLNHFTLDRHLAHLARSIHGVENAEPLPALKPCPRRNRPAGINSSKFGFGTATAAAPATLKLALTTLAENPSHKTGLTTLFHEFVSRSLALFPDVSWLIFAGPNQDWRITDPRVELVRDFPANDHLNRRLFADHFQVPVAARKRGAQALLTVGFVPTRKCLPTVLHVLSLQTLDKRNRLGLLREIYRNSMMKYNWPQADLVITNSQWTAAQILSLYPQFHDRLVISYEGLQHEIFNPTPTENESVRLKEKFGLERGYLLWVSNFYPYKQAKLLIAGYARLDPETRRRHPLVMVGGDWFNGLGVAQIQAKSLGVAKDVHYLNWVDDTMLAPLYRHAAAFCLASREETFGRCVIEAMACGTPCVLNDIPIMQEVTAGHALIVDYHDAAAVAGALRKVIADDVLAARLRASGLARVREFTFEKLTTERIAAIRRLVVTAHRR